MGTFVRRVTTASGATAVQIMHKRGRRVLGIEHIGSAHTEADLAVLVEVARVRLHAGQEQLPWGLESDTGPTGPAGLEPLVGVPDVFRIGDLLVSQAAEWFRNHSCSASFGVRYPNAEWSRF